MPRKVLKEQVVTVPQAKKILESIGEEKLNEFQRRSLDYTAKFSKIDATTAEKLVQKLTEQFGLEKIEAVEISNCMPESIEEIRTFLTGGRRIVETSKLEEILTLLDNYRKKQ